MRTIADFEAATEGGKFFTATFIKRGDGSVRVMNCRREVRVHLKGGTLAYKPGDKALMPVYDIKAQGYRQIPLDALLLVKIGGETFAWDVQRGEFEKADVGEHPRTVANE